MENADHHRGNTGADRESGGAQPQRPAEFSALTVRGFKSVRDETRVSIRPLTVLTGRNSSGKSSILQPILLMKQTLEAAFDPGPLWLDGHNVKFSANEQLFWRGKRRAEGATSFSIGLSRGNLTVTNEYSIVNRQMVVESMTLRKGGQEISLREGVATGPDPLIQAHIENYIGPRKIKSVKPVRNRCTFDLRVELEGAKGLYPLPGPFITSFGRSVVGLIHLPGLRGNAEREYPRVQVGDSFPGTFQQYTASVLSHWKSDSPSKLANVASRLEAMGLTWKVDTQPQEDTRVAINVGRTPKPQQGGAKDVVNIADVGVGVSQVLPVIVALAAAEKQQVVYIEQPEIHLHPQAQEALAAALVAAAEAGATIIVETHSDLLLLGIQTKISQGEIDYRNVAFHWFDRGSDGQTLVKTAELDQRGTFGEWPNDFLATRLGAEKEFIVTQGQLFDGQ